MSMKAKLGQNPNNQSKGFTPAAPSNNRAPSQPANQQPTTPTK